MAIAGNHQSVRSGPFLSPLRYPGGKRKLATFVGLVLRYNDLLDGEYVEPFAGGGSVALTLLFEEYVRHIHINDLDRGVYAFWHSVLYEADALCTLIQETPVVMEVWDKQRQVQAHTDSSLLELGFSTFFLNRTNRSGIISGGVIGGKKQTGGWKLDARYNKDDLISRIRKIARYRERIHLYNKDARDFLREHLPLLGPRTLLYLDPPYYVKGKQLLYTNYYETTDHEELALLMADVQNPWIVSYDDVPEVRKLYRDYRFLDYSIHYSAQDRYQGAEIVFFSPGLNVPDTGNPTKLRRRTIQKYLI